MLCFKATQWNKGYVCLFSVVLFHCLPISVPFLPWLCSKEGFTFMYMCSASVNHSVKCWDHIQFCYRGWVVFSFRICQYDEAELYDRSWCPRLWLLLPTGKQPQIHLSIISPSIISPSSLQYLTYIDIYIYRWDVQQPVTKVTFLLLSVRKTLQTLFEHIIMSSEALLHNLYNSSTKVL